MLKFGMSKIHVIIPAAGSGSRMGQEIPKQFSSFHGKTLIEWVDFIFSNVSVVDTISIAFNSDERNNVENSNYTFSHKTKIYYSGGISRSETVLKTLNLIESSTSDDDWALVHDSARVGITESFINSFIKEVGKDSVGGIVALPSVDTIKRVDQSNKIIKTEDRDTFWLAQTPQMFKYKILIEALNNFPGTPTDEAEAIEALGLKPMVYKGLITNFKITYPEDLINMSQIFSTIIEGKIK
ncbi:MAG: 2-C-methyl-D-erythritol 4-phosphate cytidylyltransferase [Methylophilaceae bacterium]|jgi:2-C-methyl-D-erythritol 4-phosphate cytidylyltransferase